MPYVFGVDGGGTQSRAILMTDRGRVVYLGRGPALNYHDVGASQVSSSVNRLFNDALRNSRARAEECRGICLGLAGCGQEQDRAILQPLFDNQFGKDKYVLMSDAQIALVSGTLSESGIIVLAGTGSMVYGRNEDGLDGRVGGYGSLLSDEGSGYHIGLDALKTIVRHHDGMEEKPGFYKAVFDALGVQRIGDLIGWVNSGNASRDRIAALAELVTRAAAEDDPAADAILERQADALSRCVDALHRKLSFSERVDIVLSGGLFSDASYYWQLLRRKIHYFLPGANVISPKLEPVIGAALYAFSIASIPIDEDLLDLARRSYRECQQPQKPVAQSLAAEPLPDRIPEPVPSPLPELDPFEPDPPIKPDNPAE